MIYFSFFVVGAFWTLLSLGFLTAEIFLYFFSFKHFIYILESWFYTCPPFFAEILVCGIFFPLIFLILLNHSQEEERPVLIYAITPEAVLLLFCFPHQLYLIGIHLLIFLHVTCFISICKLFIYVRLLNLKNTIN